MSRKTDYLKKIPFFNGLSDSDLDIVGAVLYEKNYPKSDLIFLEGERGEALFVIEKGRVKISKAAADGREQILHILKDGDIFAEVVLFDRGVYPATAEAVEDTRLYLDRKSVV